MALLNWYETMGAADCFSGHTTWNDMVNYIQHSACTDFIIHSTCTDTGQAFRFTRNSPYSKIYGSDIAGDDLMISANDVNMRSRIILLGDSDIWLDSGDDVYFKEDGIERFHFYDGESINFLGDRAIHIDADSTYVGKDAGLNNARAETVGIGFEALNANALEKNTAVGYQAGKVTVGKKNTFMGYQSGVVNTSGNYNTFIGNETGLVNVSGLWNTFLGCQAGECNVDGDKNTFLGYYAGHDNIGGHYNVAVGQQALKPNTTGDYNTAVGHYAGQNAGVGLNNCIYLGASAGLNNNASNIVAIGYQALINNNAGENTAVGYLAISATNTGIRNTAMGHSALLANTSGNRNTAFGRYALTANLDGAQNSAFGEEALDSNTAGDFNVAVGRRALYASTTGHRNVAIGTSAQQNNNVADVICIGYQAGLNNAVNSRLYINNSASAFPLIYGEFDNDVIKFGDNTSHFNFKFTWDIGLFFASIIEGRDQTTANLILKANSVDPYPYIWVGAWNHVMIDIDTGKELILREQSEKIFRFYKSTDSVIDTDNNNKNLYLKPHGTGLVKFGTYAAKGAEAFAGFITMKDEGGTSRKVMICA